MSFQIKFADFVIEGVRSWRPSRRNKIANLSLPRTHGTLVPDVAFSDELIISLAGEVFKDTAEELRDYFDDLGSKLLNFGKDRLYLRDDGRFLYAICSGTAFPEYDAGRAPGIRAGFSLEFTCGDPFWYAATEGNSARSVSSSPDAWSATNDGKVRTPARVHITNPAGSGTSINDVKVTNTTTGLFMRYLGTIQEGHAVVMDSERSSCHNNAQNDLNNFEGNFWLMEEGTNNFSYVGPTPVDVDIYWRERFVN